MWKNMIVSREEIHFHFLLRKGSVVHVTDEYFRAIARDSSVR